MSNDLRGPGRKRTKVRRAIATSGMALFVGAVLGVVFVGACAAQQSNARHSHAGTASVFVSSSGSDRNGCSSSAPCASFDRAYHVALPGAVVSVAAGSYPAQVVTPDPSKLAGPDVVFQPAGAVSLAGLVITGSHVEVDNLTTAGWYVNQGASFVTLRNLTATGSVFITSASNVSVLGGSAGWGPGQYVSNGSQIKTASGSTTAPSNILIDGVTFHDFRKTPGSFDHVDCLHILSGNGITIQNSRFVNCEAFDILFTVFGASGSPTNVLVQNNVLLQSQGYNSLLLGGGHGEVFINFMIRNNSSPQSISTGSANILQNVAFVNNQAPVTCSRLTQCS